MKDFIIVGLAFCSCIGFVADYWWLNDLIEMSVVTSRTDLWGRLAIMYVILLVPPFIMLNQQRSENAELIIKATGFAILDMARYVSIGILIAFGFYIFTTL